VKKRILSMFLALSVATGTFSLSVKATDEVNNDEISSEIVFDIVASDEPTEEIDENGEVSVLEEEIDDISYYTYQITDGNVTITDCDTAISGDVVVPSMIEGYPVKAIGNFAFQSCEFMESITLPDTITSIGGYAISYCTSLTRVEMPPVLEAFGSAVFNGCTNLADIEIPVGVVTIGEYTFRNCTSLESVQLPETVTSIARYAFEGCSNLTEINFPGVKTIGESAFAGCKMLESIYLPEIVTIGAAAFSGVHSAESIVFGENLTTIGRAAFASCSALKEIVIPGSVKTIGNNAFESCASLKRAEFLDGVVYIGDSMFKWCTQLSEVILPETVTTIKGYAFVYTALKEFYISGNVSSVPATSFYKCSDLTEITVSEDNNAYTSVDGVLFDKTMTTLIKYPAAKYNVKYTIPDGITAIGTYAFDGLRKLKFLKMPDTVDVVEDYAFYGAGSLQTVITSKSLKTIGSYAFESCSDLINIILPEGLTAIGNCAFRYCYDLVSITIPGTVTEMGSALFSKCDNLQVIRICEGITNLPAQLIEYCGYIDVYIPSTITTFSDYALYDSRPSIYYAGSVAQWWEIFGSYHVVNVVEYDYSMKTVYNFFTNGGSAVKSIEGVVSEAPVSTYNGMNFMGWYDNEELSGEPVSFPYSGEATTLYAKWGSCYSYEINDGEITITGIDDSVSGEITIPDSLFGYTVAAIGDRAFYGNDNITKVYISNYIKTIGEYAFAECSKLTYIHTGYALSMGDYALKNCTALAEVYIGDELESLGTGVFVGCKNLAAINVSSYNDNYTSVDGVLFNDDITVLIQYPMGKKAEKYIVPDTVITIIPGAFNGYDGSLDFDGNENFKPDDGAILDKDGDTLITVFNAEEYTIPDGVIYIAEGAFAYCDSLVTLRMPDSVISIGDAAFYACDALKDVYYNGTKSQWDKIQIGIDNECLINANIIFLGSVEISLSELRGKGGETVSFDVMIENNFGLTSLGVEFGYNESVMQLKDIQLNPELEDVIVTTAKDFSVKPYNITFDSTHDFEFNGRLVTLVFEIAQDAPVGEYPVTVDYYKGPKGTYIDGEDINYNENFEAVNMEYVSGKLKIYTPGDLNDDKKVNNKDATYMLRYLADWDIPDIVTLALDTNGSGSVDEFDATNLLRYIAKWNVELH